MELIQYMTSGGCCSWRFLLVYAEMYGKLLNMPARKVIPGVLRIAKEQLRVANFYISNYNIRPRDAILSRGYYFNEEIHESMTINNFDFYFKSSDKFIINIKRIDNCVTAPVLRIHIYFSNDLCPRGANDIAEYIYSQTGGIKYRNPGVIVIKPRKNYPRGFLLKFINEFRANKIDKRPKKWKIKIKN